MDIKSIEKDVETFWRHTYAQPFIDKDAGKYADAFGFPCVIRAEEMPRTAFRNRDELLPYVTEMLQRAQKTSWHTSTMDTMIVSVMEENVALVRVIASRFDANGKKLCRVYGTYTVNRDQGKWRMVSIFGGFMAD